MYHVFYCTLYRVWYGHYKIYTTLAGCKSKVTVYSNKMQFTLFHVFFRNTVAE